MNFMSFSFVLCFLPIVLILFYGVGGRRILGMPFYKLLLLASSLLFCADGGALSLGVLLISVLINYAAGRLISKHRSKKILAASITVNIVLLASFKYAAFFADSINAVFKTEILVREAALPLGLSFYTFIQLACLIDIYRSADAGTGEQSFYHFADYAAMVSLFPHLSSGPIIDHKNFIAQLNGEKITAFSWEKFVTGLQFFTIGMAKKALLADPLREYSSDIFSRAAGLSTGEAWFGAAAFTLELFFDFSGYSDMVIGIGKMLNLDYPVNFDSPYKACSIREFWRRWHITLSDWITRYLYIPLGGNRRGVGRQYLNLIIAMTISGLWHGAGWTYVVWGLLNGVYLVINNAWQRLGFKMPKAVAHMLTLLAVIIGWVFFRAETLRDALFMISAMFDFRCISAAGISIRSVVFLAVGFGIVLLAPNTQRIVRKINADKKTQVAAGLLLGLMLGYLLLGFADGGSSFIYSNF